MVINHNEFNKLFNKIIFDESKKILLEKIAENPDRYIGLFRPTKPKAKILQNVLQSQEIRFGDALENIIKTYIEKSGFENINNRIKYIDNKNKEKDLDIDQFFKDKNITYIVEQKVRDDHDSTKKVGQINNFELKIENVLKQFKPKKLIAIMYFVDDGLVKNKNYYQDKLKDIKEDYGVETYLFYGKEFFEKIINVNIWNELLKNLENWKNNIPELPEINFDFDVKKSFEETKNINTGIFRKLFSDEKVFKEILLTISPNRKYLNLLLNYFKENRNQKIYETLYERLDFLMNKK